MKYLLLFCHFLKLLSQDKVSKLKTGLCFLGKILVLLQLIQVKMIQSLYFDNPYTSKHGIDR
jgi:hypothetical protein